MTKQVFISYRRKQGNVPREVKELKEVLTRNGYTVFLDKHELRGKWKEEIMQAIKNCGLFVFVLTEDDALEEKVDAGGNDVVYEEIRIAKENNKDIRLVSYLSTDHTEQALKCENEPSKKKIIDILNNNQHLPELSSDNEDILNAQYQYFLRFLSDIIKPILTDIQSEIVKNVENGIDVTFYTDADCLIFENNKIFGELSTDDCKTIKFKKGIHRLHFKSKESKDIYYLENITIGDEVQVYDIKLKEKLLNFYVAEGDKYYNDKQYNDAIILYRKAAEKGDAKAQHKLVRMYLDGEGVNKNMLEAIKWAEIIANNSEEDMFSRGAVLSGVAYEYFKQGAYENAKEYYLKAISFFEPLYRAKEDKILAIFLSDVYYRMGLCFYATEKYEDAMRYFRWAAELDSAVSQCSLGVFYHDGLGCTIDKKEAVKWYRKAAEKGYAKAQYYLGRCYHFGDGIEQDYKQAVEWFRKAAEQEFKEAQYYLGICYFYGKGVEQDYEQAVKWFRKAAEQGHADAQYHLGLSYDMACGIEADYEQAVKWFRKAAEQGHNEAQADLAYYYCFGKGGVEQDDEQAVKWYRKAAEQGNMHAQNILGNWYYNGYMVEQDYKQAVKWFRKAAEQGDNDAIEKLKKLGVDLS